VSRRQVAEGFPAGGVVIPAQFEERNATIEVVFNSSGQIAGLLFR
jgi:hypothetical protein